MQAGQDHLLSALGRLHDKKIFLLSYEAALKAGFDNINLDLIFSLPNQTTTDWEETLEFAALLKPTHISAYSLIIEEGTDFYRQFKSGRLILPDEETDRKMYEQTENILLSHGYEQYEISNYSKPGYECKHNIKYWARDNTLGFGLSSHSFYNETRWRNTINLREYMSQPPTRLDVEHLRDHDAMAETMILGLRLNIGISAQGFKQKFGVDINEKYGEIIEKDISAGLLYLENGRLKLTKRGRDISNYVFVDFI
jgi:oxygen-independent coproporphyrinogen-3 oxidase